MERSIDTQEEEGGTLPPRVRIFPPVMLSLSLLQSAKLTTSPRPEASTLNAGPVVLSRPLARLASENLTKLN